MKLNYKRVMLVGFAFLVIQAFWMAYDAIVPLMLVNKFGMNQTWSGLIMAVDNVLAIFLLPIFGTLSDKCTSKYGKRTPYIVIGTICAAIAFMGLSFVDYAQYKKLGEQAAMPEMYYTQEVTEKTENAQKAHDYFWEEDFTVINKEYSEFSDTFKPVNGLDEELSTKDYVATILFGKSGNYKVDFDSLNSAQQQACKDWYKGINLNTTYVFSKDKGYTVYEYTAKDSLVKITFDENGKATPTNVSVDEAKVFGAVNVYSSLITEARSSYAANSTYKNPLILILFMAVLLITLFSMAIFRSPAVALMPDVVVPSLRSKANAVINLMGMVGGILILGLGMVIGTDKVYNQLMPYMGYIACVCAVMVVGLIVYLFTVKEPLWSAQMLEDSKQMEAKAEVLNNAETPENAQNKRKLTRSELTSLLLILASVAFWYMGYNAITSKYSLYSINVLAKPYNLVLIVAQAVSLVAFIPIGIISSKIGRKKMILIGIVLLFGAFFGGNFIARHTEDWVVYLMFAVAGIGWAAINVNSFPMVVELASVGDIGKFTGYYYTASMAAQILTPVLSGFIMDLANSMTPLFIYSSVCVLISFITMLFVKHGDSKPEAKKSALEYLEGGED